MDFEVLKTPCDGHPVGSVVRYDPDLVTALVASGNLRPVDRPPSASIAQSAPVNVAGGESAPKTVKRSVKGDE